MAWWDFFKKRGSQIESKDEIRDSLADDKIDTETLRSKISKELEFIDGKFDGIRNKLRQRILRLNLDIEELMKDLKTVNIEGRREDERLKSVVQQNLKDYLTDLGEITSELGILDHKERDYVGKVQLLFSNFIKNSATSLEKARILIGKEIISIKETINLFADDLALMIKETSELSSREREIHKIESLLSHFESEKNEEKLAETSLSEDKKRLEDLGEKIILRKKDRDNIIGSKEYKQNLERKKEGEEERNKIKKEILELRHSINWKNLAKHFHNNEKKNKMIKEYEENFEETLKNDEEIKIAELIKEADKEFDVRIFKEIKNMINESSQIQKMEIERKIEDIDSDIRGIDSEISELKKEIEREQRKVESLIEKTGRISDEIKKESVLFKNKLI